MWPKDMWESIHHGMQKYETPRKECKTVEHVQLCIQVVITKAKVDEHEDILMFKDLNVPPNA